MAEKIGEPSKGFEALREEHRAWSREQESKRENSKQ
jgi:hypothetical protein